MYRQQKVAVLIASIISLATGTSESAPILLADEAMNQVTAGEVYQAGGVISANSSNSQINNNLTLELNNQAQSDSRSLNLVNSNNSAVANTSNIWQGDTVRFDPATNIDQPELEVNQLNQIHQQQLQSANLTGYSRPDAEQSDITRQQTHQSYDNDLSTISNASDFVNEVRVSESTSQSAVDTSLILDLGDQVYIEGHVGQGVASSGTVHALYDGGSAEFALGINGGIKVGAGTGVEVGILGSSASVEAEASAELGLSLLTRIELPEMEIELSGAGCGVILGSCNASGSSNEMIISSSDHSTLDVYENHQSANSDTADEFISVKRSSFELESASADYIVIDDASLELDSEVSLELSESTQKDARAMNLVNAIGSTIANATNVSTASQFENTNSRLILNQYNLVRHGE